MPIIVGWIGTMLLSTVGQMALSALVSLGIGFAGSKGLGALLDYSPITTALSSAGPMLEYLGFFGVDKAMTIVLSAWSGRAIVDAASLHMVSKRKAG